MKSERGVTLLALILSIIVILILSSIAVYSGTSTVKYTKFNKAKSEIQILSAQVNKWNEEYVNGNEEVLSYGTGLNENSQDANDAISRTFNSVGITDEGQKNKYRFFSEQFLKNEIGIDTSFDYLINIEDRDVLLVAGVYYNKRHYFTLKDFGIINIESNLPDEISFEVEQGTNKEIVLYDVKIKNSSETDGNDISKFNVQYKKVGEELWEDVTKDLVKFEDGEASNKVTKFKFSVKDIGKYDVKISSNDKKISKTNSIELYEKQLTEEAPDKICVSTLDYTASSEDDDSNILTIDGAMLLSAGSQATPSRVENDKFVWRSSNPNVATVTTDGVVKCGTEAGIATISLIGLNNTKTLCNVRTTAKIAKQKQESNYTINGQEGSDVNPTIPGGFYAIDTNITETASNNIDWKLTGNQTNTGKGLVIMNDAGDQFVWVPVKKDEVVLDTTNHTTPSANAVTVTSNLYTPMATTYTYNGNTYDRGMLYTFAENTTSTTVKYNSGWAPGSTNYREPSLVTGNDADNWAPMTSVSGTDFDVRLYTNAGYTEEQGVTGFGAQMQTDYDEMITQVQAYGGFWVGRFESSWNDKLLKVASVAGAKSFTDAYKSDRDEANMWYGLYRTQKAYSSNSSMIWGSQYDAMMNWMAKNGITVGTSTVMGGTARNIGNSATNGQRITGNPKYNDKLSNVIDIYGNSFERTLEAEIASSRTIRGGAYSNSFPPSRRFSYSTIVTNGYASRLTLYIK